MSNNGVDLNMMPAEHAGHTHTRTWYKVRWVRLPGEEGKWKGIVGRTDIIMDEDFQSYKDCVEIIEELKADTCATVPALGFGRLTEEQIDSWIKQNKK